MSNVYETYEEARVAAAAKTLETGVPHIACYRGRSAVVPYDVKRVPQVGDDVSMGFNGDYYPVGQIHSISASGEKITTTTGRIFRRPRKVLVDETGREFKQHAWTDGCFWLVHGVRREMNPHL